VAFEMGTGSSRHARGRGVVAGCVLLAFALVLGGCDWPQFLAGPQHTGYNAGETRLTRANVGRLRVVWQATQPSTGAFSPAVVGGRVYVEGGVLDAGTGAPVPEAAGVVPGQSPAVTGTTVVGCQSLFGATAVDTQTGAVRWSVPDVNCSAGGGHAIANGVDYLPVGSGPALAVGAFRVATGQQVWRRAPCPNGESLAGGSPTVGRGVAVVRCFAGEGVIGHTLVAVDAATGRPRWATELETSILGSVPVIAGDRVFVGGGGLGFDEVRPPGEVFCLDIRTGALLWRTTIPEPVGISATSTDGDGLYVLDTSGVLRRLDPATGAIEWTNWTEPPGSNGAPAVANGVISTASFSGRVEAFDTRDGRRLFTTELGQTVHGATPVVANGTLYVNTSANGLVALRPPA